MTNMKALRDDLDAFFVNHPRFAIAEKEVEDLIARGRSDGEADCLMVTGPAGTGKTTIRKRIERKFQPPAPYHVVRPPKQPTDVTAVHRPVLILSMPTQPRPGTLFLECLKAIGDEKCGKYVKTSDASAALDDSLELAGTGTIVFDEAQRLIDRAGALTSEAVLEEIKRIHGNFGISFVFLGLGRVRSVFQHDAQLRDRWGVEVRLEPFRCFENSPDGMQLIRNEVDWVEWRAVLTALENVSKIPSYASLSEPDLAFRLFIATGGVMRGLKVLLRRAITLAERADASHLSLELLKMAFESKQQRTFNPFLADLPARITLPAVEDDYVHTPLRTKRSKKFRRTGPDGRTVDRVRSSLGGGGM